MSTQEHPSRGDGRASNSSLAEGARTDLASKESLALRADRRAVLLAVVGVGVSSIVAQLALLREMMSAFAGVELVLGVVLGNWFLLTGLGSFLGRFVRRLRDVERPFLLGLMFLAILPPGQVFLLRAFRDVIFLRGQLIGPAETVLASAVLLLPYCLLSGWLLTLACEILARRGRQGSVGSVYIADTLGSIAGGAASTFILIPLLDHIAVLYIPAVLTLILASLASLRLGRRATAAISAAAAVAVGVLALATDMDGLSTRLQHRGQSVVFRGNSPYGRLVVTESAGQKSFIENGLPILSTNDVQEAEEAAHYAMAQRPQAQRVLLIGGGVSGTAREVLKYSPAEVTYVELDPLIVDVGRRFVPEALADPRLRVVSADGRQFLRQTGQLYDVILLDVPDPSTSQINRFYTAEFFRDARRHLREGGVLSLGLGRYENYLSPPLTRLLTTAKATLAQSFRHVLLVPGGRVFFLASDGEVHADIAERIAQAGVRTRLMNHGYLDAVLSPDRMAALASLGGAAPVNKDFSPVLYYYHLLYWASQFKVSFGVLEAVLLASLGAYVLAAGAAPRAIFASGFAASSLEVVLLLGFQVLCGSVYRQLGVIVTLFMVGLAAGALLAQRRPARRPSRAVAIVGLALAAVASCIPAALKLLAGGGALLASQAGVQIVIGAMTFLVASLVGLQFPLAAMAERTRSLAASRLYVADFLGACLGALLASTLLIPLLGVATVCWLAAGLNVIAAGILLIRKGSKQ